MTRAGQYAQPNDDPDDAAAAWYGQLNPLAQALIDWQTHELAHNPRFKGKRLAEGGAFQLVCKTFMLLERTPGVRWPVAEGSDNAN